MHVTVFLDLHAAQSYSTICYGGTVEGWTEVDGTKVGTTSYERKSSNVDGCDSTTIMHVTVLPELQAVELYSTICYGGTVEGWTEVDGTKVGTTSYERKSSNVDGCDSTTIMYVTVLPAVEYAPAEEATICFGGSYSWRGQERTASANDTLRNALGCDSIIYTLNLTVLPETVTENEKLIICESDFPYSWRGQTLTTIGTYNAVDKFVGHDCDSVIYVLELKSYVMTLPDNVAMPIAVCDNPVDVTAATADIEDHIASTDLYAPNAEVTWYINGAVTNDPIKGGVTDVTVKYVITTDCGTIESEEFVVTVEAPTPENDVTMDKVLVVSKYENRIFLLHLKDFERRFEWTPTPEEVTWYKVVDEVDIVGVDGPTDNDILVGTGHAYNEPDGSIINPGEYYAVVIRATVEHPDECHTTMKSVILSSGAVTMTPELVSNVVAPEEDLRLINLNSDEITEVYVYNLAGELIDTYVVDHASEFIFDAAHASGYYMVDVKTANSKTTLRYIVK
jgi:hypothetical protein